MTHPAPNDADSIVRYFEAEAACLHCGRPAGVLRSPGPVQRRGALFVPAGGGPAAPVRSLADRRCLDCGGPLCADPPEPRHAFKPAEIPPDRPRRGRPPAWLVAARRAAAS
jgi:hypothetical protein